MSGRQIGPLLASRPRGEPAMPTPLPVDRTISDLRARVAAWRRDGARIGLVPTMGALHRGHLALIDTVGASVGRIVVSIFVNPTQFAPTEDFGAYPRDEAADLARLGQARRLDAVFAPAVAEMYPSGFATTVAVAGPALGLERDFRPHFFAGVATVVSKLLLAGAPRRRDLRREGLPAVLGDPPDGRRPRHSHGDRRPRDGA